MADETDQKVAPFIPDREAKVALPEPQPDQPTPDQDPAATPPNPAAPDPADLTSQFKKDELKTAAEVQGVDVPAGATKADIASAIVEQTPKAAPVTVNNFTRRSDDDAVEGSWVDVVAGEHEGRFGSYRETKEHDPASGYPTRILVRTRDALNELIDVAYAHVRPSKRTGGR